MFKKQILEITRPCYNNILKFQALPRLHATAIDRAHELINGESGIKGETGKILQN